ncbi:hypothetical protein NE865_09118 [Phthorimaea operculella]|nr:hypothetical protein NE865_09118 [Phthorimaea operculella]
MKLLFSFCIVLVLSYVAAQKPCTDFYCGPPCADDEYLYSTGCSYKQIEPTCENPNPGKDMRAQLCDYSKCYCKSPKVRDTTTNQCVCVEDCPPPVTGC